MRTIVNEGRRHFLKASAIIGGVFTSGLHPFDRIFVAQAASATTVYKLYAKDVYENLKYRPTWLPGSPVELGAVGVIEEGIFRSITDLKRSIFHSK